LKISKDILYENINTEKLLYCFKQVIIIKMNNLVISGNHLQNKIFKNNAMQIFVLFFFEKFYIDYL